MTRLHLFQREMQGSGTSLPSARVRLLFWIGLGLLAGGAFRSSHGATGEQPHFRITGVVVNARDGAPLARCRMAATLGGATRGQDRQPVEGQSDEHGRFALDVPAAGNWRLTASGRNLHQQPYEGHDGFFTGIVLTATQPTIQVVFRAVADGTVSGLVIDEVGEPVRNAPVFLIFNDPAAEQTGMGQNARTQQATTDDRGRYEFSGLDAGSYLVNVRARPWYAAPAGANTASLDPSLDVVYPVTWYPGTTDDTSATPITVRAGERVEANFHLSPVPSAHLRLPAPTPSGNGGVGGNVGFRQPPQVALLLPHGGMQPMFGNVSASSSGELDVGGLAPGTYQVTLPGSGPQEAGRTMIVQIASGGTVTEVGSGLADSTLSLTVDGDTELDASRVLLTDTVTGRVVRPGNGRRRPGGFTPGGVGGSGRGGPRGGIGASAMPDGLQMLPQSSGGGKVPRPAITVELPPGRYEVSVSSNSGAFLTGLTAKGAEAEGRFVTVRDGNASLVVHLASGLASVEGVASFRGKPAAGALVLLIPATLGASSSLADVHRDQSNTDGSFHLAGVTPGQYILVAIDHGWGVRWNDPATLQPYLLHGSPLDLKASATVRSNLEASAP